MYVCIYIYICMYVYISRESIGEVGGQNEPM